MIDEIKTDDDKRISVAKIYMKDFSFESPQALAVFRSGEWKPKTNLNLRSSHNEVEGNVHEVVLTITVEAKEDDKTIFLIELHQSGLFDIAGYEKEEFAAIIGSFCPAMLFPYARETIATTVQKGGFPEFVLQPINFDALYRQSLQHQAAEQAKDAETH